MCGRWRWRRSCACSRRGGNTLAHHSLYPGSARLLNSPWGLDFHLVGAAICQRFCMQKLGFWSHRQEMPAKLVESFWPYRWCGSSSIFLCLQLHYRPLKQIQLCCCISRQPTNLDRLSEPSGNQQPLRCIFPDIQESFLCWNANLDLALAKSFQFEHMLWGRAPVILCSHC